MASGPAAVGRCLHLQRSCGRATTHLVAPFVWPTVRAVEFYLYLISRALIKQAPRRVDIYEVSLEGARYQHPEEQAPFVYYIQSLFAGRELDAIVAMGGPAARFV